MKTLLMSIWFKIKDRYFAIQRRVKPMPHYTLHVDDMSQGQG